ncbi:MAG: hypothetical protein K0Q57_882, partial [Gammaproteobacteria bacterium]|nr:hypothetical protein [Gammaproteobacteria bacterium]
AQFEAASKQFKEVVGHSGFEQAEIAYNSYEETINKLNEMLRGIKTQGSAYLTEKMVCQDKLVERLSTILASLDTIQSKLHDSLDRKKRIMKALRAKSIGWYGSYIELRNTLMEKHKCLPEFIEVMQSDNTFLRDPKSYFLMTYKGADESDLTAFRQNLAVLLVEIIGYADDYIRKRQPSFARSLIQLNEISAEKIKWANVLKDFTMTLASSSWHTVQKLWALYHLLHQLETTNQNKRLIDEPGTHFPKMIRQCRGGVDAAKELLPSAIGELDESDQSEFYQVRLYTPAMNEELAHDQKSISSSSSRVLAAVGSFLSLRAGAAAYSPARGGAGGAEANGGAGHEHSTSVFPWGEII